MKKILTTIFLLISLVIVNSAQASELYNRNDIFTPSFQLLWNDLKEKIATQKINFYGKDPYLVYVLNSNPFTTEDVSENSCYKIVAPKSFELKAKIIREIFDKFEYKSTLLDEIDWNPDPKKEEYILYALFIKNIEFLKEMQVLEEMPFKGSSILYDYFGVVENQRDFKDTIVPLYYYNEKEFAVSLNTKEGDRVVLYRTNSNENVFDLYSKLDRKVNKKLKFGTHDELRVPFINLDERISYDILCNRRIFNTDYIISKAIEDVKFTLDNKGASLKNEAIMQVETMSIAPTLPKKVYNFDNDFIIYLIEKDKNYPYFALRISDFKDLVK